MYVLVACEESQEVCKAFRNRGHEAYSCDYQECSGGHPEWHIRGNATDILDWDWDMIIAHPPCTYLTSSSAMRLFNKDHNINEERYNKGIRAVEFFMRIYECDCPKIAIENPTPMKIFDLPQYTQIIEPYMFGDPWKKRTCLWLKGLPKLVSANPVSPTGTWVGNNSYGGHRSPKIRSKTFPAIARAMAEQWG